MRPLRPSEDEQRDDAGIRSTAQETVHGEQGLSLAVADVGWFNTENLFREIDRESVDVLLLKCFDYVNGWRRGVIPVVAGVPPAALRRRGLGTAARLAERLDEAFSQAGDAADRDGRFANGGALQPRTWRRGLVMSYPHYLHLHDLLRPDVSVYYNIDDYALYWPRVADEIRELERAMVRTADLTICVSRVRADELRGSVAGSGRPNPSRAPRSTDTVSGAKAARAAGPGPADLAHLPRPYLGFIGSLEDRLDWELMDRISRTFPEASIVVVGRVREPVDEPWWDACSRFLSRPNVHALGWRGQEALAGYYQAFDVTLIPYRMDHPFNRACNPTKIMDAMGSGRPIVATAIPECRLHAERFDVARDGRRVHRGGCQDPRPAIRRRPGGAASCVCSGQYVPR